MGVAYQTMHLLSWGCVYNRVWLSRKIFCPYRRHWGIFQNYLLVMSLSHSHSSIGPWTPGSHLSWKLPALKIGSCLHSWDLGLPKLICCGLPPPLNSSGSVQGWIIFSHLISQPCAEQESGGEQSKSCRDLTCPSPRPGQVAETPLLGEMVTWHHYANGVLEWNSWSAHQSQHSSVLKES